MVPLLLLIYLCLANGAQLNETEKTVAVVGKGRALSSGNLTQPESALDDVSMEEDETSTTCIDGETVDHGCEEKCVCVKGKLQCKLRCEPPLVRNRHLTDHNCFMKPSTEDKCCSILVCSSKENEEEIHEKPCVFKNETYKFGEVFHDGCTSTCSCLENGEVDCKSRCPETNQTASLDRCLSVADAKDPCCTILYCDVNAGDELVSEDDVMDRVKIVSAVAANSTTVMLNFDKMSVVDEVHAEISLDQMKWTRAETFGQAVVGLKPGTTYYFRVINDGAPSNIVSATLPNLIKGSSECEFKGKMYKIGEEFHDGCTAYCSCSSTGIECATIECPTDFGLDVLDPKCLAWDIRPANFTPTPPKCCPETVVCKNNGSCVYKGDTFDNWADIPDKLSGCEEKCYCAGGNVTCRPRCPTVPSSPPPEVPCPPTQAILTHPQGDDCCLRWMCPQVNGKGNNASTSSVNDTTTDDLNDSSESTPFLGPYSPDIINKIQGDKSVKNTVENSTNKSEETITSTIVTYVTESPLTTEKAVLVHLNDSDAKIMKKPSLPDKKPLKTPVEQKPVERIPVQEKPTPNFPIGIINPDHLDPNTIAPLKPPKTLVSHEFLDHLLEQHKIQEINDQLRKGIDSQSGDEVTRPHEYNTKPHSEHVPPYNIKPHSENVSPYNIPIPTYSETPNRQYVNQMIPPYLNPYVPFEAAPGKDTVEQGSHAYNENPNKETPHLYQTPGHPAFNQPNTLSSYENIHNFHNNRFPHKPTHPYFDNFPRKEHPFISSPDSHIGLHDYIDSLRKPEETDSRTKDSQVYVLASQPPNVRQGVPPALSLPGFPPHSAHDSNSIAVHHLEAVDENTVRLVFSVPLVLVGLHGRVELRYTADNKNSDPSTWEQQVLAPPNDLIATPELEFELRGLQPDTEYKIKITVVMRDIQNSPASQVLVVKTPPSVVSSTLPPIILVEPDLHLIKVNSTWATLGWRKFTDYEMQFIDGVQLRYKEIDDKIYQATPLIHRAVTSYSIEDLKPDSQYNLGIFFIPFPGQTTELQAQKTINLSTAIENDPYKFELQLDVHHIKSQSVEVRWSGVPYPEDKYVNIFRAIYQFEGGREEKNSFKVAKRDSPAGTLITGLQPDTRYRLWLEAYLTNGRIKKSNVKDFTTKQGNFQSGDVHQGKLEGASIQESNDYYGPLVGVSILAAIAILTALGLLFIIARKHGHNKAPITAAVQRKSAPHMAAYDNPSYKVEMQHETMDL